MSRGSEIKQLSLARLRLFLREPEAIFWSIVFPVILALVLGYAFSGKTVEPSRIAIMQHEGFESLRDQLEASDLFEVIVFTDAEEARRGLRKASIDLIVNLSEPLSVRVDPVRPEAELAQLRLEKLLSAKDGSSTITDNREEETGFRYIDFLFPGLMGMNFMGTGIWGIGFAVVDLRRKRLLRRFLVTPMRKSSFLLSFLFSRIVFVFVEVLVLLSFGAFALDVPFHGSGLTFALVCVLGSACFFSIGLLVASRPKTLEGASGLMNLVMMPMWLASGVFFSYERYPEFLHPFLRLLPLSALNDALRGVVLDGAGIADLVAPMIVMVVWAIVSFSIALRIFRWQ
ncbi:MAG: ABC-2 type transport system permease protein [Planctomycetota bacterium]|jgi:ABC-2 type transport system permease protein